jgi:hypothetical protein
VFQKKEMTRESNRERGQAIGGWVYHYNIRSSSKSREQDSQLDQYLPYLFQRWSEGCHNMACLFRELVERGYQGSYGSVYDNLVRLLPTGRKHAVDSSSKAPALATSRQAAFLFLRRPEKLRVEEQETVAKLRQIHPEVDRA